jgi:hypothetical protein
MSKYTRRGRAQARVQRTDILVGVAPTDERVEKAINAACGGYSPHSGELLHVEVEHDEGCPYLLGVGACRCAPVARILDWWRPGGAAA